MSLIFPFYGGGFFASLYLYISRGNDLHSQYYPMCIIYKAVSSNFMVAFVGSFPTKKCGDGNRCSVGVQGEEGWFFFCFFFHKWMTSHNFFDFGVTCSTFISLCLNIRNTGLYFYLVFDFLKLRKNGENVFSQGPK